MDLTFLREYIGLMLACFVVSVYGCIFWYIYKDGAYERKMRQRMKKADAEAKAKAKEKAKAKTKDKKED
eukprot:g479.t1